MAKFDRTKVMVGTASKIYVDGKLIPYTSKVSWKMSGEFEEAKVMGEYGEHQIYLGYSGEGSVEEYKTASALVKQIVDGLQSGVLPDVEMIIDLENKYSSENETVKLKEVVFTEAGYDIETKSPINEELPFKFAEMEFLNTI
jgi:hypothetical protein